MRTVMLVITFVIAVGIAVHNDSEKDRAVDDLQHSLERLPLAHAFSHDEEDSVGQLHPESGIS
jgi:hypothetical protein